MCRQSGEEPEEIADDAVDGDAAAARIGAGGRQCEDRFCVRTELGRPWLQSRARRLPGFDQGGVRSNSQSSAQHLQEWLQHLGADVTLATAPQQLEALGADVPQHFFKQARLAESGAADNHGAALRGRSCLAQKARQEAEYLVATDEGRQAAARGCLEAPGRRASTQYQPRLRHSGSRRKVRGELEEVGMRPKGVDAGEDLIRPGVARQMRCRVHDVADQVIAAGLDVALGQ